MSDALRALSARGEIAVIGLGSSGAGAPAFGAAYVLALASNCSGSKAGAGA